MTDNKAFSTLKQAISSLKLNVPEEFVLKTESYLNLLWRWNKEVNLTRHVTYELFAARDLVDVLAISHLLKPGESVLDVGTGGGLLGVPLSLLRPDLRVFLCDSVRKKACCVSQIAEELRLPVTVVAGRGEELVRFVKFDTLLARAVAPLEKLLRWFGGKSATYRRLLVFKGPTWKEELRVAEKKSRLKHYSFQIAKKYERKDIRTEGIILSFCPKKTFSTDLPGPEGLLTPGKKPFEVLYSPQEPVA